MATVAEKEREARCAAMQARGVRTRELAREGVAALDWVGREISEPNVGCSTGYAIAQALMWMGSSMVLTDLYQRLHELRSRFVTG